jgi:hypothetical protein
MVREFDEAAYVHGIPDKSSPGLIRKSPENIEALRVLFPQPLENLTFVHCAALLSL